MNASPPYSQFDSKGRCVNHPAVQMRCKKLGGGWKTLTSICAMCAMESLRISDNGSCDGPRRPPTTSASSCHRDDDALVDMRKRHDHRQGDDRSVDRSVNDQSVLSAPAAYHRTSPSSSMGSHHHQSHHHQMQHRRRRSVQQDQVLMAPPRHHHQGPSQIVDHRPPSMTTYKKQPSYDSSSSSCDLTVDMYDPDVNSYASSRSESRSGRSTRGGNGNDKPLEPTTTEEEEGHYVCGMAYEHGTYYTGQIDVNTRLPHGLGTLRRKGGVLLEGEWQQGTLVAPVTGSSCGGGYRAGPSSREDDIDDDERYCLPTTDDEQEEDDDASSISSTPTEWTSASSSPRNAAYSARERKPSILPYQSHPPTMAMNGTRATFDRLLDYEGYVDKCDEEGDWYHEPRSVREAYQDNDYDRVRRVRFLGDP